MSIFLDSVLENVTQTNYDVPVYEGFVNPEPEGLSYIMQEAVLENYQIQSSLMVMDAVNYSRVTEGHDSIVTENAITTVFKKMREAWNKLWSKVRAWFSQSIEGLKTLFMGGEKFVKEYKNDLLRVDTKGFKYKGHKWNFQAGSSTSSNYVKKINGVNQQAERDFPISNPSVDAEKVSTTDYMTDTVYKSLGQENLADIKKDIIEAYHGGDDGPQEIENFSAVTIETMIKYIESYRDILKGVENSRKESDKMFKNALSQIDAAAKEAQKASRDLDMTTEEGKKNNKIYSRIVSNATSLDAVTKNVQSIHSGITAVGVQVSRGAFNEFVRVLKSVRTYKGVKESYVSESASGSDDIFSAIFENMR